MTIYEKIAKLQDELQSVKKDAKNPHFKNTYATYEQVLSSVYPTMRKLKLMSYHSFRPSEHDNHICVITRLRDLEKSDESITSELDIPMVKADPQAAGSTITYAKRYSLLAILGLGTEDDDAEAGVGRKPDREDVFEKHLPEQIQCKKHDSVMDLREGKYGLYYSHKIEGTDDWHNLDAKEYLKKKG